MAVLIGREKEERELEIAYQSDISELIALYGRRRVGKTFLVRTFFERKSEQSKDVLFFSMIGTKEGTQEEQTKNFSERIADVFLYPGAPIVAHKNWRDTFRVLTEQIRLSKHKKIVLFFDEFPWMVTRGSRLVRTFEYFWNQYWSFDARVKLIICGSSSGWILKNIVNNRGGLYNRVTRTIHLQPFNLSQTKKYLHHRGIKLTDRDIVDLYLVMGGIPFYLSKITPGYSAAQVIAHLAFEKGSFFLNEFDNLYATLFDSDGAHVELARILSEHSSGLGVEELVKRVEGFSSGGRVVSWLFELEQAGFITRLAPFGRKRKGIFYKMTDEYSLFYFRWLEPRKRALLEEGERGAYWELAQNTPGWNSWSGYAFEALCLKHIRQIREALNLNQTAQAYTWRFVPKKGSVKRGAQIDLMFDRADNSVTLCEVKYTRKPFVIDKEYAQKLQTKIEVFKEQTTSSKNIFIVFVSAQDLKKTLYSEELVSRVVTLTDLFKNGVQA